jgi:Rieske Fe-S protein
MDRREFVKRSCAYCLGGSLLPVVAWGCQSIHYVNGAIDSNSIAVLKTEFTYLQRGKVQTRLYIIVENEKLEFPIYVYRFSENEYSALWMKCAHQGAELQALGDHLQCPSHGSEFNNRGIVSHGPAEQNLRAFPVAVEDNKIRINLRPT